jgi:hypothetical protein
VNISRLPFHADDENLKRAFWGSSGGTIMQIAFRASSNQLMANQPNARAARANAKCPLSASFARKPDLSRE